MEMRNAGDTPTFVISFGPNEEIEFDFDGFVFQESCGCCTDYYHGVNYWAPAGWEVEETEGNHPRVVWSVKIISPQGDVIIISAKDEEVIVNGVVYDPWMWD